MSLISKVFVADTARYRWMVASRVLLAVVGGYLLSSLAIIVLAMLLPVLFSAPQAEALLTASLWSFVIYGIAVMFVFTAHTVLRAAVGLSFAGILLAVVYAGLRLLAA
ncbi:hypothetical protein DBR37_02015 [Herminiimonas sp. KBW02]|uniref:hypothetical protein n=1 Tax=Herminiimonas sp. KBW02 TaxID=2153363 RepID=UPI000F5B2AEF|nr:hypothetical protein [Herminiimonas sp. KBW02]RQO36997.1 hypothetical protein DBR37_02015 [Herminiimonas sp. KBW02]